MQLSKLAESSFGLKKINFMILINLPLDRGDTFSLNQILLVNKE